MTKPSNQFYTVSFFILFGVSTAILLIARTARTPAPIWGGYLDIGIVVLIVFTGFFDLRAQQEHIALRHQPSSCDLSFPSHSP
jgi:hypothetical protein